MPEFSRFIGIIIRMFAEMDVPHHTPHFHARPSVTLKCRDLIIIGFKDTNGALRIAQTTPLTSTLIENDLPIGRATNRAVIH